MPTAKKKAAPAAASAADKERRICPELRIQAQKGYEVLLDLLEKAGHADFIEKLGNRRRVDDVLADLPEAVPALLDMGWELRDSPKFRPLFQAQDGGGTVQDRTTPVAPCGRTFDEVVRAHLMGATRIYLDRLERAWAEKEAKREAKRHAKEEAEERKSLGGRLSVATRKLISGDPTFDARDFRDRYPGHGVYGIIKPYLREEWQFSMVRAYGRLRTKQAEALGSLLTFFKTPEELEPVLALKSADISVVRGVARAFAEVKLGVRDGTGGKSRSKTSAAEQRKLDEMEPQIAALEMSTFEDLVTHHSKGLETILKQGASVDGLVRRLTPIFGDEVWLLFGEPHRLRNVMNVPEHVAPALGRLTQHVPPQISRMIEQIANRELGRDLMVFAAEEFGEDDFARFLNDEERLKIWQAIPGKFNNSFNYQPDAMAGQGSVRNAEDLRMVCAGLFESLRQGQLEKFA